MTVDIQRYSTAKHPSDPSRMLVLNHTTERAIEVQIPQHMVYIRLTERAEHIDGIYLPERSRDDHVTLYEVIAIGGKVNEYRERERRFKGVPEMDRNAKLNIEVGDTILIPEKATGEGTGYTDFVKASSVSRYEGYIDKGLILAKV